MTTDAPALRCERGTWATNHVPILARINRMEILREFWAIILAAVAALVWLVRLESRGLANEREIRRGV